MTCLTGRDGHSPHLEAQAEHGLRKRIASLEALVDQGNQRVLALLGAVEDRDAVITSHAVLIARCPVHGLHGERDTCFICGGEVEQVPMVPAEPTDEMVERAARAAFSYRDAHEGPLCAWDDLDDHARAYYLGAQRAALAEVLVIEPTTELRDAVERARLAGERWFVEHPDGASSDDEWRSFHRAAFEAAWGREAK